MRVQMFRRYVKLKKVFLLLFVASFISPLVFADPIKVGGIQQAIPMWLVQTVSNFVEWVAPLDGGSFYNLDIDYGDSIGYSGKHVRVKFRGREPEVMLISEFINRLRSFGINIKGYYVTMEFVCIPGSSIKQIAETSIMPYKSLNKGINYIEEFAETGTIPCKSLSSGLNPNAPFISFPPEYKSGETLPRPSECSTSRCTIKPEFSIEAPISSTNSGRRAGGTLVHRPNAPKRPGVVDGPSVSAGRGLNSSIKGAAQAAVSGCKNGLRNVAISACIDPKGLAKEVCIGGAKGVLKAGPVFLVDLAAKKGTSCAVKGLGGSDTQAEGCSAFASMGAGAACGAYFGGPVGAAGGAIVGGTVEIGSGVCEIGYQTTSSMCNYGIGASFESWCEEGYNPIDYWFGY